MSAHAHDGTAPNVLYPIFTHSLQTRGLSNEAKVTLQDMYGRYLNLPTEVDGQLAPTLRLLWTLFILAKAELLGPLPDLVSSFNLLVCVVNVILAHLPQSADSPDFADKV